MLMSSSPTNFGCLTSAASRFVQGRSNVWTEPSGLSRTLYSVTSAVRMMRDVPSI